MKWGVRRGRTSKAYEKASKKLNKLDRRVNKQEAKMIRKAAKADAVSVSPFVSKRRKLKVKHKAEISATNYRRRVHKANKWYQSMNKTFKDTDISMTAEQAKLGKRYVETLRATSASRYY
jgi:hypothetical protein